VTLTVGRCVLPGPSNVDASGDFLSLSGVFYSTATTAANRAAEAQARSAQLMGMVDNPDEDVFPLVWSSESMYDGFYAVEDASWSWLNDGSSRAAVAAWSLTLRRVSDYSSPKAEIQYVGTLRTNAHSITTTPGFVSINAAAQAVSTVETLFSPDRTTDDGVSLKIINITNGGSGAVSFEPVPDEFYDGRTAVEVLAADGEWYPAVGRQIGRVAASSVRLTNHYARLSVSAAGVVTHAIYDSTAAAWESATFTLSVSEYGMSSYSALDEWSAPTIIRNDGDTVVVRYNATSSSAPELGATFVTVTLRVGDAFAFLGLASALFLDYKFGASSTTAATSITGGLRRTSNDANGNRWAISTPMIFAADTTNGAIEIGFDPTKVPTIMVGQSLGGSAASGYNNEQDLVYQFMTYVYVKTRIVAR